MPDYSGLTHYWQGTDGDPANGSNYDTGLIPDTGDRVILDGSYGNGDIYTNLDYFATYDTDFNLFYVDDSYTGDIGLTGENGSLEFVADKIVKKGPGRFFYSCNDTSGVGKTYQIVVNSETNFTDAMTISGGNGISRITCTRGKTIIAASATSITWVFVDYFTRPGSDARLEVTYHSAANITNMLQGGGLIECDRAVTNGTQTAGRWVQDRKNITGFNQGGGAGATMIYNAPLLTTLNGMSGTTDLTDTKDVKVITTYAGFKDHNLVRNETLHTITTDVDMTGEM